MSEEDNGSRDHAGIENACYHLYQFPGDGDFSVGTVQVPVSESADNEQNLKNENKTVFRKIRELAIGRDAIQVIVFQSIRDKKSHGR
jgi:hypothetical protein